MAAHATHAAPSPVLASGAAIHLVHHVVAVRGAGRVEPEAYQTVRRALAPASLEAGLSIHAWALVQDGLQLCLSSAAPASELPTFFAAIEARLVEAGDEAGDEAGPGFVSWRAVPVAVDTHLFVSHLYVERLPVQRGLALWPWAWPWSSHAANANGEPDDCLVPHAAYRQLGIDAPARRRAYRALFELELDPRLWEQTEERLARGEALGSIAPGISA